METIQKIGDDLILPKTILKRAGISRDVVIVINGNEIRIRSSQRRVTKKMIGLGKDIKPDIPSIELVKELRREWKID